MIPGVFVCFFTRTRSSPRANPSRAQRAPRTAIERRDLTLLTQEDEVAVPGLGGGWAQLVRQHRVALQRARELAGRRAVCSIAFVP